MNKYVYGLLVIAALSGCSSSSLADEEHTVDEYYNDPALSAATLEACRGTNSAERRLMAEKAACRNVEAAEKRRAAEEWGNAVDGTN